jgi:hypothetical protein
MHRTPKSRCTRTGKNSAIGCVAASNASNREKEKYERSRGCNAPHRMLRMPKFGAREPAKSAANECVAAPNAPNPQDSVHENRQKRGQWVCVCTECSESRRFGARHWVTQFTGKFTISATSTCTHSPANAPRTGGGHRRPYPNESRPPGRGERRLRAGPLPAASKSGN